MPKTVDRKSKPALKQQKKKKKTTYKKISVDFLKSIQVPLDNKFDALNEEEDITDDDSSHQKHLVSPLVITDHKSDINKIISDLNMECQFKLLSIGRKVFCKTIEDKTKLSNVLKTQKINFFSHPKNNHKIFKAVLTGLPEVSTNTIEECSKTDYGITPLKIILFNTNASSKLYLCHFNKSDVDMKLLNTITSIYHHIVK